MTTLSADIYVVMNSKILSREWRRARDLTWRAIEPYISPTVGDIVHYPILQTAAELGIEVSDLNMLIDFCNNGPYEKKLVSNRFRKTFWICIVDDEPKAAKEPPEEITQEESFRRMRRRIRW